MQISLCPPRARLSGANPCPWRLSALGGIALAAAVPGAFGHLTRQTLSDAFIGVSVFVAATLLLVYGLEHAFRIDLGTFLKKNQRLHVPVAAIMGVLPGCAGAVVITAAYSSGTVSLGAMIAALTATMGDAAFLLIATRPDAALALLPIALLAGVVTGYLADLVLPPGIAAPAQPACDLSTPIGTVRNRDRLFFLLVLPGLILGILDATAMPLGAAVQQIVPIIGVAGAAVALLIWAVSPIGALTAPSDPALTRMSEETGFITFWVVAAFLAYEWVTYLTGYDLITLFATIGPLVPLIAILIGFIPGCGPQIVVTTLFLNGAIPFSALIGNAISNDGDALFPAIALAPKAALVATILTTLPALVVAYGFYTFAPNFMN